MKKLISLIKAVMSSDMNMFKVSQKKNNKKQSKALPIFLALLIMFTMWGYGNMLFEILSPQKIETLVLSLSVFLTSLLTIYEGIYKSGQIMFNCKDDDLLLSLPIKRSTVLFLRIFKFYIFEFAFNSLFFVPLALSYIGWAEKIDYTFFLSTIVMAILLPVIPIVISCIIGAFISGVASRFKYKKLFQTIITLAILSVVMFVSFNIQTAINYVANHADKINDIIIKVYYPAGLYAKLVSNFNYLDLIVFILINIVLFVLTILILSKFYFKINTRLKSVTSNKKVYVGNLKIKSRNKIKSLIVKEVKTFFNIPVFIVNAGFGLFLYLIAAVALAIKFDSLISLIEKSNFGELGLNLFLGNKTILIMILIVVTSFLTSITNSVISLEGRNINILKSLPIKTKEILMSKIYAALLITTPPLLIGDLILIIRFKIGIIDSLLFILLSILIPLVSHFLGLIINLKYPKLDAENSAEVVKQSTSSFVAVMIGMGLIPVNGVLLVYLSAKLTPTITLAIFAAIYIIVDLILYAIVSKSSSKKFDDLSI